MSVGTTALVTIPLYNGNKYVGEWKDNQKTGQGTYTWKSGDTSMSVEFKDDKNTGQGVLTFRKW